MKSVGEWRVSPHMRMISQRRQEIKTLNFKRDQRKGRSKQRILISYIWNFEGNKKQKGEKSKAHTIACLMRMSVDILHGARILKILQSTQWIIELTQKLYEHHRVDMQRFERKRAARLQCLKTGRNAYTFSVRKHFRWFSALSDLNVCLDDEIFSCSTNFPMNSSNSESFYFESTS